MGKITERNPIERTTNNMALSREIEEQDLVGKSAAGLETAVGMTLAGKCGVLVTFSAECNSGHKPCA